MAKSTGVHEKGTLSLAALMKALRKHSDFPKVGAVAVFVGVVRGITSKGERVQGLELEAYDEKADEVLTKICDDLKEKPGIIDVQIHHLLGKFNVGDDLVYVLVAGSQRKSVFPVLEEAVERYKKEAPIFKKELVMTEKGEKKAYWTGEQDCHQ